MNLAIDTGDNLLPSLTNTCFRLARLELGQIVVVGGRALRHDASESEVRVREGGEEVVACVDRKINCRHRS